MRIAIPYFQNRVSSRLDCCESLLLATVEQRAIIHEKKVRLLKNRPVFLSNILEELGVDVLICDAIPETYLEQVKKKNIKVYSSISGDVHQVLMLFLDNKLENNQC